MRLVIAGGGTGGHIFAGVAIAQEFKSQSLANEVLFVGSEYGLEVKLVPKSGFPLVTLKLGKLVKQSIFRKCLTLFQIPIALLKCIQVLRSFKANMVVGVGGYAAGPCIIAAWILKIPTAVLEQNAVLGFTNKITSIFSTHVFLTFNNIPPSLPARKCILTGNPIRNELKPSFVKPLRPFVVFVFGGSQGATGINQLVVKTLQEIQKLKDIPKEIISFVHQTGEKNYEWVKKEYENSLLPVEVHRFIDDMQSMYNRASLVICRAGSSTIAELAATRNAAIFIPFPFAAGNHQEYNARLVEKAGGAKVLIESQASGEHLAKMILFFMENPKELEKMRENITGFYRPDAAKKIVEIMKIQAYKNV